MKKIVYLASLLLTMALTTSCEKEEVGGTATESLAGDWYVICDAVDAEGNIVEPDFNEGRFHVLTYNTAENSANKLYVDDDGNLLGIKVVTDCSTGALTFANGAMVETEASHNRNVSDNVQVTDGKILLGAGRQNNGSPADSISFYVQFEEDAYAENYGFVKYHIHGVRYSGLEEND